MGTQNAAVIEPGSLADRVCRWFGMSSNRGEERTPAEIGKQFDCPTRVVIEQLECAVANHLLVFTQGGKAMVYQRGPQLERWVSHGSLPVVGTAARPARKRRSPTLLADIDASKLKVRKSVPPPPAKYGRRPKGTTRWDPVFDRLEAAGHSVLLDLPYLSPIKKAAQAYTKRTGHKFVIRRVDDKQFGIWRE